MKILFTGGVTGGHFYPIIAIAKEIREVARKERLLEPKLYFMAPGPYDERLLFENNIEFLRTPAGGIRRYFSLKNIWNFLKTIIGIIRAIVSVFVIYPDVIFGKGGYGSFPALLAARLFRIPVFIHESDTKPGRVNAWASKFAERIAISYPEAAKYFPEGKAVLTGQPIRKEIAMPIKEGATEYLHLESSVPTILVMGGSQGAERLNNVILDVLPKLLNNYQVIHQTGEKNFKEIVSTASVVLEKHPFQARYKPFPYLNELAVRMSSGVASIAITRAGSTLFEIASWGIPAIIVPIPEDISHDQVSNAFAYARVGAGIVIEEKNLTPGVVEFEVNRIMGDDKKREEMGKAGKNFAKVDAAEKIAQAIFNMAIKHES